ncbi:hypothetical protein B5E67_02245 [Faecalibacterium sp. An122]|nr:hypothetical protein B5E67_02245 [Faecalibacterium sp. An122]
MADPGAVPGLHGPWTPGGDFVFGFPAGSPGGSAGTGPAGADQPGDSRLLGRPGAQRGAVLLRAGELLCLSK